MRHVILLKFDHLIGGLLCEEFNGNALIVKCYLALVSYSFTGHRIPDTARSIFILPDSANQLMSSLDIDLSSLHNLLQYLCILPCQLLHLPYRHKTTFC